MRAKSRRYYFSIIAGLSSLSMSPATLLAQVQLQDPPSIELKSTAARSILEATTDETAEASTDERETEKITDRYPDGKVFRERSVALDDEGDYTNHGEFREFSRTGEIVASGSFRLGQRTGIWFKLCQANEAPLFTSYPFVKFRAPFMSTASFEDGKLNGVWTITDRDNKVVSQIELRNGLRNGLATFYHPNGQIHLQSDYAEGVLNGRFVEKSLDGKIAKDDLFQSGQRTEEVTEYFANKKVKSVTSYLSATLKADALDDWDRATLATYSPQGSRQLHGDFTTYHDNGQLAARGHYQHGQLHGKFESFHRNAEVAAMGTYEQGLQTGPWVWRHSNGMKSAVANYVAGELDSMPLAWDESGKAIRPTPESTGSVANSARRLVTPTSGTIVR